jgi:hypothetical protein
MKQKTNIAFIYTNTMILCPIAKLVLLVSILIVILDTYLFGVDYFTLFGSVFYTLTIILATNYVCYNAGFKWFVWSVLIFHIIGLFGLIWIIKNRNNTEERILIEKEKKYRRMALAPLQ